MADYLIADKSESDLVFKFFPAEGSHFEHEYVRIRDHVNARLTAHVSESASPAVAVAAAEVKAVASTASDAPLQVRFGSCCGEYLLRQSLFGLCFCKWYFCR